MIPKRFIPLGQGDNYFVLMSKGRPGWWSVTLAHPVDWLRRAGILKRQPLKLRAFTDPRLGVDNIIYIPTEQVESDK